MSPRPKPPYRVIVADDHSVVRRGVSRVLEEAGVAEVVATAADAAEAVAALLAHPADVIVLDLAMSEAGVTAIETVHRLRPSVKILVYSMHAEREWASRALAAGASGYVSKDTEIDDLPAAVLAVAEGRRYVSEAVVEQLLDRAIIGRSGDVPPHERLSNREYEVFLRLARGEGPQEIATALGVSPNTVTTYRARVLAKFEVDRNADLTRYAMAHGILEA